ncbi:MAG: FAD-binding protein, partial [Eggerthellaceae bacterium]
QLGLPESTLDSIRAYNADCEAGVDSEYHKDPSLMIPVAKAPFYGAVSDTSFFLTVLGGLRTDDDMRVCDEDDNPIEGLYNVGSMAGDMFYAQTPT